MNPLLTKILVPLDFSDNSKNCLQTAIAIASRHKASLILLHVIEQSVKYSPVTARDKLREYFSVQCEAMSSATKSYKPEYQLKIIKQSEVLHQTIIHSAMEEAVDLLVMGKFGMGGNTKLNIGPTVRQVIQNCQVPILMVPPEGNWLNLNRIVLPVRLIQGEIEIYEYLSLIIHKNKAELLIAGFSKSDAPGKVKELLALVKEIKLKYTQDQIHTTTRYSVTQTIGWEINSFARSFYADLVVLSSKIDDEECGIYSGIYSRQILDYAKIPVLCIGSNPS